jgi:hypothetical protein
MELSQIVLHISKICFLPFQKLNKLFNKLAPHMVDQNVFLSKPFTVLVVIVLVWTEYYRELYVLHHREILWDC